MGSPKPPFFAKSTYRDTGFLVQISYISLFHPGEQIITEFFKTDNSQYFFVKISMANNITASLYHLGVEIDNFVMDESNNLGFLQVYSLTQLIKGL